MNGLSALKEPKIFVGRQKTEKRIRPGVGSVRDKRYIGGLHEKLYIYISTMK